MYESNGQTLIGQGGSKEIINGIDVWHYGTPPREYSIIAIVDDKRHASGLIGRALMEQLHEDAAEKALELNADAVILESSSKEITGYFNTTDTGYGSSSIAKRSNFSRFLIINYVD
ncbi:hypothetical protein OA542_00085 [Opitutae bacterium]|nr:hypothetical protein [Opitutae bacterium]